MNQSALHDDVAVVAPSDHHARSSITLDEALLQAAHRYRINQARARRTQLASDYMAADAAAAALLRSAERLQPT